MMNAGNDVIASGAQPNFVLGGLSLRPWSAPGPQKYWDLLSGKSARTKRERKKDK